MTGEATSAQVAGFAVALRAKGETAGGGRGSRREHAGARRAGDASRSGRWTSSAPAATGRTRSTSRRWPRWSSPAPARPWSSTATARRRASAGRPICWRASAWRSRCPPTPSPATVQDVGIGFCFAPVYHPSYRHAGPTRRELGIPTVFNFLGPLTNPAQPAAGRDRLRQRRDGAGDGRGVRRARRGRAGVPRRRRPRRTDHHDHVDRLGGARRHGPTRSPSTRRRWVSARAEPADLRGGDVEANVAVARDLFAGRRGPVRDAVVLNAAAGLATHAGLSGDLSATWPPGRTGRCGPGLRCRGGCARPVGRRRSATGRRRLILRRGQRQPPGAGEGAPRPASSVPASGALIIGTSGRVRGRNAPRGADSGGMP